MGHSMLSSQGNRSFAQPAAAGPVVRARSGLGLTLIELLVAVAIVAILAAIAYPTYRSQIQKTRRADAKAVLMQDAQFLERGYTENGCYNRVCSGTCTCTGTTGTVVLPFAKSPIDGTLTYYGITLQSVGTAAFTLLATPNLNGPEAGAGTLTLDNTGTRVGW